MNNGIRPLKDAAYLYNYLSSKGVIKRKRTVISGEEGYMSPEYRDFKKSLYGMLVNSALKVELLGECNAYNNPSILLKVTSEDGRQGIVDIIAFKTIVPVAFESIHAIAIGNDEFVFIANELREGKTFKAIYTVDGRCVIKDADAVTPVFTEEISYGMENEDEDGPLAEITYALKKEKRCSELLVRKRIGNRDVCNLIEVADDSACERDIVFDPSNSSQYSLLDTLVYSAFRARKKGETELEAELAIQTSLLLNGTEGFDLKYSGVHQIVPAFFDNSIFNSEEEN